MRRCAARCPPSSGHVYATAKLVGEKKIKVLTLGHPAFDPISAGTIILCSAHRVYDIAVKSTEKFCPPRSRAGASKSMASGHALASAKMRGLTRLL